MLIDTADFGKIDVPEEKIYSFPEGILGFEEYKRFALLDGGEEDIDFMWLQSMDEEFLCFILFDPFSVISGYSPSVTSEDLKFFGKSTEDGLKFMSVSIVTAQMKNVFLNLRSPIIFDAEKRIAKQVILENLDYPIRFEIYSEAPQEAPPDNATDGKGV